MEIMEAHHHHHHRGEKEEEEEEEGRKSWALHANGVASAPSSSEKKRKLLRKARQQRRHSWVSQHPPPSPHIENSSVSSTRVSVLSFAASPDRIPGHDEKRINTPTRRSRPEGSPVQHLEKMLPHEQLLKILEKENKWLAADAKLKRRHHHLSTLVLPPAAAPISRSDYTSSSMRENQRTATFFASK
mmetsp:Transcript_20383/g.28316  ORF Transcript_20383/g.28316 Transcript_20383/m.28316 type:complete len:187 (-) Transcript_20383:265-825(-)